jgi:hypothetical protein
VSGWLCGRYSLQEEAKFVLTEEERAEEPDDEEEGEGGEAKDEATAGGAPGTWAGVEGSNCGGVRLWPDNACLCVGACRRQGGEGQRALRRAGRAAQRHARYHQAGLLQGACVYMGQVLVSS